jgi:predicted RNA-binding protein Jag
MKCIRNLNLAIIFLLAIFTQSNCQSTKIKNEAMKKMVLQYTDGSGNNWNIMANMIKYVPVSPQTSSSGFYSGGKGADTKIKEENFAKILEAFQSIVENNDIHLPARVMTSGQLIIKEEGKQIRKVIFKNGKEMESLEELLNGFLRKEK